ncbi:hypothetical protein Tco_1270363 [Tanacetum coccineum]
MKSLATWWKDDGIIRQCLCTVANGHFTVAVKVLSSSGVASYCDDTIKALEAKHPYKPPSSMSSSTFSKPPIIADIDSVFSYIKSFLKGDDEYHNDGSLVMLTVDFLNAFNLADRSELLHENAVLECLRAPHAHDFLLAILIDGLGQHMPPLEYHSILKYRLIN